MKTKTLETISIHLFFILGFIFLSISLFIIVFVSGQWEEDYKKELQEKYDRDYYKASLKVDENDTGEYFQDTKNIIIYTKNREFWSVKRISSRILSRGEREVGFICFVCILLLYAT